MGLKEFKLFQVDWMDHCSFETSQWRDIKEYKDLEPSKISSVGYLIKEEKKFIVLGQSVLHMPEDDDFEEYTKVTGDICILKSCITNMKELKQ